MGSVKEYLYELWSQIDFEVTFECPECGQTISESFKGDGAADDISEEVRCLNDECECDWVVIISKGDFSYSAHIDREADTEVSLKVEDPWEGWDEPEPEPGAYGIFVEAMREWHYNVDAISEPEGWSSRNRMLFGTLYSIAEAYFSDAIVGSALVDTTVQRALLKVKELGLIDKQLTLETVLDKPEIVQEMIRASLQGLSYHNLVLVNGISRAVFRKPILPQNSDDRAIILSSVQKRHDCVHRNGLNMAGNVHRDITPQYLREIGRIFSEMAATLDRAVFALEVKRNFDALPDSEEDEF
jgi:hypothetical protein